MLFTGDHVMQGSTVVINPPDGDMRAYLASLERLLGEDIAIIAPGHGYLIGAPHREVKRLVAHRLAREAKVTAALQRRGASTLEELVVDVYDEVSPRLHPVAMRSLTAHLDKLVAEGRARQASGRRRGGQPGHPPHLKQLLPPERVNRIQTFLPRHCAHCGSALPAQPAPHE